MAAQSVPETKKYTFNKRKTFSLAVYEKQMNKQTHNQTDTYFITVVLVKSETAKAKEDWRM